MPVVAAKAAARQIVLHDVEEVPEAAVYLNFAVAREVIGGAQARGNLLAPSEIDALKTGQRVIGRQAFLVQSHAQVQGQPAPNSPRVLNVESMVPPAHLARGAEVAKVDRAPQALAGAAI